MRLVEWDQKEDYQPHERGDAFPQYYENGDRYRWDNPMMWAYRWWLYAVDMAYLGHNSFDPMWLMGGEL